MQYLANETNRRMDTFPKLSTQQQTQIITLATHGHTIKEITQVLNISYETLARAIVRDPLFAAEWRAARQASADLLADELVNVLEDATSVADAMIGRAKSDNIRTRVAWLNPQKYSPKQQIEVTHSVDLSKALEQADQRASQITPEMINRAEARSEIYGLMDKASIKAKQDLNTPIELPPLQPRPPYDPTAYAHNTRNYKPPTIDAEITVSDLNDQNAKSNESPNPGILDTAQDVNTDKSQSYVVDQHSQSVDTAEPQVDCSVVTVDQTPA